MESAIAKAGYSESKEVLPFLKPSHTALYLATRNKIRTKTMKSSGEASLKGCPELRLLPYIWRSNSQ